MNPPLTVDRSQRRQQVVRHWHPQEAGSVDDDMGGLPNSERFVFPFARKPVADRRLCRLDLGPHQLDHNAITKTERAKVVGFGMLDRCDHPGSHQPRHRKAVGVEPAEQRVVEIRQNMRKKDNTRRVDILEPHGDRVAKIARWGLEQLFTREPMCRHGSDANPLLVVGGKVPPPEGRMSTTLRQSAAEIAELSLRHLEAVVAIDSQSDERTHTVPSTPAQRVMGDWLERFFRDQGCAVERDPIGSVIVSLPGRGRGAAQPPLALMVHLDTSRGTQAVPALQKRPRWDGKRLPYPRNERLWVDVENYPDVAEFVGQDLLFGPGEAAFGLDDKLGLTHLMTLVVLLRTNVEVAHPPLVIVARPDEEIGSMVAVEGVADILASKGVRCGFTIDGILPFEVNIENFNASQGSIVFPDHPPSDLPGPERRLCRLFIGGVNTHGATAKAEGFRAATRLAAELLERLRQAAVFPSTAVPIGFRSMPLRDCDAELEWLIGASSGEAACQAWGTMTRCVEETVGPHLKRGASFRIGEPEAVDASRAFSRATCDLLQFVGAFLASRPGFVLPAEESEGHQGYSNPFRALPVEGGMKLDLRLRDFSRAGLDAREQHVQAQAAARGLSATIAQQYVNMGPRLADRPELIEWPKQAARAAGIECRVLPIRGGTGVDPFLDRGIPIANVGTGYFAPESEKEFTSMQMMAAHAQWLARLVEVVAQS